MEATHRDRYEVHHQYDGKTIGFYPVPGGYFSFDNSDPAAPSAAFTQAIEFIGRKPKRKGSQYVLIFVQETRTVVETFRGVPA